MKQHFLTVSRWRAEPSRFGLAFKAAGSLALALGLSAEVNAADTSIVTRLSPTAWRIDTPNVNSASTSYPQIQFLPGDQISIMAGGCAQTGGHGKTWKRYVDPHGDDSDRLYHGLIQIPGVTNGPVRIQNLGLDVVHVLPTSVSPADQAQGLYLRLGYEDGHGDYGDNGYWGHDDGTQDQCKASKNAFVLISIGHGVAPVPASSLQGITADNFRCAGGWSFRNFDTASLSFDSYKRAFHFAWYDYLDPLTIITFYAARDNLASGGNCAGMALLAEVAEDQFRVEDLAENLNPDYPGTPDQSGNPAEADWRDLPPKNVATDINVAHWQQLSGYFLHEWLESAVKSPSDNAAAIAKDLGNDNYNYGLLSIAHGSEGHVITPIKVTRQGNGDYLIDVYDSNRPCASPSNQNPVAPAQVRISGTQWSFKMGSGDTWSGHLGGDALAYIPYHGPDAAWRKLGTNLSGLVAVAFGAGNEPSQISDAGGRTLYMPDGHTLRDGPQGLGLSVLRVPMHGQAQPVRPRTSAPAYVFATEAQIPPSAAKAVADVEAEYGPAYAHSGAIYLVRDTALKDLTFQLRAPGVGNVSRMMVSQGRAFVELRVSGTTGRPVNANVTLHAPNALLAGGMSVQGADQSALRLETVYGETDEAAQTVRVRHLVSTDPTSHVRIQTVNQSVQVTAREAGAAMQMTEVLTDTAGTHAVAPRAIAVLKE